MRYPFFSACAFSRDRRSPKKTARPIIGESEKAYALAPENRDVRGLAIDDSSPAARGFSFWIVRASFSFTDIPRNSKANKDELTLVKVHDLRKNEQLRSLGGLRGLGLRQERRRRRLSIS